MRSLFYVTVLATSLLSAPVFAQEAPTQKDHPLRLGPYDVMVVEMSSDNGVHFALKNTQLGAMTASGMDLEEVTGDFGKMLNALGALDYKGYDGFIGRMVTPSRADGVIKTISVAEDPKDGKIVTLTLEDFPGMSFVLPEWAYYDYSEQVAAGTEVKFLFVPMDKGTALVVSNDPDQSDQQGNGDE